MSASRLRPNASDPGTDTLILGHEDGHVFMVFERPVKFVKLDAVTAVKVAEQMARDSYHAMFGDTPTTGSKSVIAEQKRATLVKRVELMIKSMQERGDHPSLQANAVVDAVMTELA